MRCLLMPKELEKDKGFAWVVCFFSFISHGLTVGFAYGVLGTLNVEQRKIFDLRQTQSSWIGGLEICSLLLGAPLASFLMTKTSTRIIQMFGGTLSAASLATCYWASQPWHLYILFGLINGFGLSCCFTASSEILAHHFKKYIYLATALVKLGFYLGLTFFPYITQRLFAQFHYHKTMGILASLQSLLIIVGIFYQRSPEISKPENSCQKSSIEEEYASIEELSVDEKIEIDKSKKQRESSQESLPTPTQIIVSIKGYLKEMTVLLRSLSVVAFILGGFLCNVTNNAIFSLINSFMIEQLSISDKEAALGPTIMGALCFLGVILVCSISQLSFDRLILNAAMPTIYGFGIIGMIFVPNKHWYYILMSVYGITYGAQMSNTLAIAYDICGPQHMVTLFSLFIACEGVGGLIGPPLCSMLVDELGNPSGLVFAGSLSIISALITILAIVMKCRSKDSTNREGPDDAGTIALQTSVPSVTQTEKTDTTFRNKPDLSDLSV